MPAPMTACNCAAGDEPLDAQEREIRRGEPPQRLPYSHWVRQDGEARRRSRTTQSRHLHGSQIKQRENHRRHEQRQPQSKEMKTARGTIPPSPPRPAGEEEHTACVTDTTYSPATTAGRAQKHGFASER
jgi:hypothetical protein